MMNAPSAIGPIFIFLWAVHVLSVLAFAAGFLFLLFWAYKHLTTKQLKQWGLTLLAVGAVACFLTIAMMGHPWTSDMRMKYNSGMGTHMMGNGSMMDDDDMDMMSMKGMTMMLEGKTGDDFDKAFLRMMIPHHQGAIDMAELVEANAKHAEIKGLAKKIMTSQQSEINDMNAWLKAWGYSN